MNIAVLYPDHGLGLPSVDREEISIYAADGGWRLARNGQTRQVLLKDEDLALAAIQGAV